MKPKVKQSEKIYSGYFDLRQDILERQDGVTRSYTSILLSLDAVSVLAQTKEGLWILNREYRHPTGGFLLGAPGGRLEKGEDPVTGGMRELLEETGYWSDDVELLGTSYPFSGLCNQRIYFIWAKNCFLKAKQTLDLFEVIQVELKSDEELQREILKSDRIDGILCAGLWYKSLHERSTQSL